MNNPGRESGEGIARGSFASYTMGFVLALLLSLFAFSCIMLHLFSTATLLFVIVAAAVAQILVHLSFFLHMNHASTPRWNIIVFGFAMIVIAILIGGSMWIMLTANHQMMPPQMPMT
jgi:cytochrome o ubiquinol oxidase operon protein cyoD